MGVENLRNGSSVRASQPAAQAINDAALFRACSDGRTR
jgi:hypothetical protein